MAYATKPGNVDRGWNDPPIFLHSSNTQTTTPSPRKSVLTQRAYHSVMGQPTTNVTSVTNNMSSMVLLPPASSADVSNFPAPILIPQLNQSGALPSNSITPLPENSTNPEEIDIPHFSDDQQLYHYVSSRLKKVLVHASQNMGTVATEEVAKKLKIFEKMWESGKISYRVKASMAKLSIALHEGKCDLAHKIHLSLMMDFISEVGSWMVAVKRLIQEGRLLGPLSPVGSPCDNTSNISHISADSVCKILNPNIDDATTSSSIGIQYEQTNEQNNNTSTDSNVQNVSYSNDTEQIIANNGEIGSL